MFEPPDRIIQMCKANGIPEDIYKTIEGYIHVNFGELDCKEEDYEIIPLHTPFMKNGQFFITRPITTKMICSRSIYLVIP